MKYNNKKTKAKRNNKNIVKTIISVIIEWTTSDLVSGFLPIASATFEPKIPIPIPIPKNAKPNIKPIAVDSSKAISAKGFSGMIHSEVSLGYEVVLKLDNCVYQGGKVDTQIQTKFVNR